MQRTYISSHKVNRCHHCHPFSFCPGALGNSRPAFPLNLCVSQNLSQGMHCWLRRQRITFPSGPKLCTLDMPWIPKEAEVESYHDWSSICFLKPREKRNKCGSESIKGSEWTLANHRATYGMKTAEHPHWGGSRQLFDQRAQANCGMGSRVRVPFLTVPFDGVLFPGTWARLQRRGCCVIKTRPSENGFSGGYDLK